MAQIEQRKKTKQQQNPQSEKQTPLKENLRPTPVAIVPVRSSQHDRADSNRDTDDEEPRLRHHTFDLPLRRNRQVTQDLTLFFHIPEDYWNVLCRLFIDGQQHTQSRICPLTNTAALTICFPSKKYSLYRISIELFWKKDDFHSGSSDRILVEARHDASAQLPITDPCTSASEAKALTSARRRARQQLLKRGRALTPEAVTARASKLHNARRRLRQVAVITLVLGGVAAGLVFNVFGI